MIVDWSEETAYIEGSIYLAVVGTVAWLGPVLFGAAVLLNTEGLGYRDIMVADDKEVHLGVNATGKVCADGDIYAPPGELEPE